MQTTYCKIQIDIRWITIVGVIDPIYSVRGIARKYARISNTFLDCEMKDVQSKERDAHLKELTSYF